MKNYNRSLSEERTRRDRFVTGHEEKFETVANHRTNEHEGECARKRMQEAVKGMFGRLDGREHRIIVSRYGLNGVDKLTLEQLGKELGVTKERVRQIESRALERLRKLRWSSTSTPPHPEDSRRPRVPESGALSAHRAFTTLGFHLAGGLDRVPGDQTIPVTGLEDGLAGGGGIPPPSRACFGSMLRNVLDPSIFFSYCK